MPETQTKGILILLHSYGTSKGLHNSSYYHNILYYRRQMFKFYKLVYVCVHAWKQQEIF